MKKKVKTIEEVVHDLWKVLYVVGSDTKVGEHRRNKPRYVVWNQKPGDGKNILPNLNSVEFYTFSPRTCLGAKTCVSPSKYVVEPEPRTLPGAYVHFVKRQNRRARRTRSISNYFLKQTENDSYAYFVLKTSITQWVSDISRAIPTRPVLFCEETRRNEIPLEIGRL